MNGIARAWWVGKQTDTDGRTDSGCATRARVWRVYVNVTVIGLFDLPAPVHEWPGQASLTIMQSSTTVDLPGEVWWVHIVILTLSISLIRVVM